MVADQLRLIEENPMPKAATWKCRDCHTQGNTKAKCRTCDSPAPSRVRINR